MPACSLRREAEVSVRSFDTDGVAVDELGIAKDEVDRVAELVTWRR